MNKIILTGGAGYIGNSLIDALPETTEVIVIDNFHIDTEFKRGHNAQLSQKKNVTLIDANVGQVDAYKDHLHDADALVYMASLNSYAEANRDPILYLQENAFNMQLFLNALKIHAPTIKKAILTSTRGIYGEGAYQCDGCHQRVYPTLAEALLCPRCGSEKVSPQNLVETDLPNPSSMYGVTKKLQEDLLRMYAQEKGIEVDIFRIFNVYGENQGKYYSNIGIVPRMFTQIQESGSVQMSGNGAVARDFVEISDIVEILLKSLAQQNTRVAPIEVYNLGSGEVTTIADIVAAFEELGYVFEKKMQPAFGDIQYSVADNTKVRAAFDKDSFQSLKSFVSTQYKKNI